MKKSKILGISLAVVLTLALVLGGVGVPRLSQDADAAVLAWSPLPLPSIGANALNAVGTTDIRDVAVASDGTLFAADGARLLKSVDGGYQWAPGVFPAGTAAIQNVVLSPNYATDQTVFCHDAARVYRSTNGGANFAILGSPTFGIATDTITSIDVAPDYSTGIGVVMIGVADSAATISANGVWLWGYGGVLAWTDWSPAGAMGEDVTSVKFSPNYPLDATVLCVGSNVGVGTRLHLCAGTNAWDAIVLGGAPPFLIETGVAGAQIVNYRLPAAAAATIIQASDIALPSNYNSTDPTTIRHYVSICCDAAAPTADNDVYLQTGAGASVAMGAPLVNAALVLSRHYSDIEFDGDFTDGTLYAGNYCSVAGQTNNVARCANPTSAVPLWYQCTNRPSGVFAAVAQGTAVALAPDIATSNKVYVGTMGVDSAVGNSINGAVTFNETGMIDTTVQTVSPFVADVTPSPSYGTDSTIWLVTTTAAVGAVADGLMDSIWKTTDSGNHWDRVHWMNTARNNGIARLSNNYPTDNVAYFAEIGAGAVNLLYSADDGITWSGRISPIAMGDVAAPNATTIHVSQTGAGNVITSPNAGWTWPPAVATGAAVINDLNVLGSDLLAGSAAGTVHHSADGGNTWGPVGAALGAAGNVWVDFAGDFATSNRIYATEAAGNVNRWVLGTDTMWTPIDTGGSAASSGIVVGDDNTLYQADPTAAAAAAGGVRRSLDPMLPMTPVAPTFEWCGTTATATPLPAAATLNAIAEADNTLFCIDRSPGPDDRIMTITDTLSNASGGVGLVGPANDSVAPSGTGITLSWDTIPGATNYQLLAGSNSGLTDFAAIMAACTPAIPLAGVAAPQTAWTCLLPAETPIYWAVQTAVGGPLRSPLSSIWHVQAQLTAAVNAPTPVQPTGITAVDVALTPVFNWSALRWANNYNFQLATDSGFTNLLVDEALGNATSYAYTGTLDYSTVYFWRVQATSAVSDSDWSAGVGFTTMAAPVEPPPPVVIEPPAPAPEPVTWPPYATAIIIIGAVLMAVVIVLIYKTRARA